MRSTIQAAVTMGQIQKKLDLISQNLGNVNTPGYKSRQANFASLLFQQIDNFNGQPSNQRLTPAGIRVGSGAMLADTNEDLSLGSIKDTGRALDLALLNPKQYFQVQVTDDKGQAQPRYTRDGSFYLQPDGNDQLTLVTSNGHPVIGENGPIKIDARASDLAIRKDGTVLAKIDGMENKVGKLSIVQANRPRLLEATEQNLFRLPNTNQLNVNPGEVIQGVNTNNVVIQSGALESSNVDMAQQMTDMMLAQRAYQFNGRAITIGDQMMGLINQLR